MDAWPICPPSWWRKPKMKSKRDTAATDEQLMQEPESLGFVY